MDRAAIAKSISVVVKTPRRDAHIFQEQCQCQVFGVVAMHFKLTYGRRISIDGRYSFCGPRCVFVKVRVCFCDCVYVLMAKCIVVWCKIVLHDGYELRLFVEMCFSCTPNTAHFLNSIHSQLSRVFIYTIPSTQHHQLTNMEPKTRPRNRPHTYIHETRVCLFMLRLADTMSWVINTK